MNKAFRIASTLWALVGATGCGSLDNCPDSQSAKLITGGLVDTEALTYESKPWGGPLDHFPAKSALWFEHGLGVTPLDVIPYLAFKDVGTHDAGGGSVAPSAGNQSLIDCVDSRFIVLRNDTCEESFYVRVTARDKGTDPLEGCGEPPAP